jgi:hypothetical protein
LAEMASRASKSSSSRKITLPYPSTTPPCQLRSNRYDKSNYVKPMSFDTLNGDNQRSNLDSRLLNLPIELLDIIASHIPGSSLHNLALTCRDCLTLARGRQFAGVGIHLSRRGYGKLVGRIFDELADEKEGRHLNKSTPIYKCIRKLIIGIDFQEEILASETSIEGRHQSPQLVHEFHGVILRLIAELPHLHTLGWLDTEFITPSIWSYICFSSIRDLTLYGLVKLPIDIRQIDIEATVQLTSLHLYLVDNNQSRELRRDTKLFEHDLLPLVSNTLECLSWVTYVGYPYGPSLDPMPSFPRLKELRLNHKELDVRYLEELIPPDSQCRLRVLEVSPSFPAMKEFFQTRGTLPTLEHFIWGVSPPLLEWEDGANIYPTPFDLAKGGLEFLKANCHIKKFTMVPLTCPDLLDTVLIPLLVDNFHNLTSLSLTWASLTSGPCILSPEGLKQIGRIVSLQQLCLDARSATIRKTQWEIRRNKWVPDHSTIRDLIQGLTRLKILAITCDYYNPGYSSLFGDVTERTDSYYEWQHTRSYVKAVNQVQLEQFKALTLLSNSSLESLESDTTTDSDLKGRDQRDEVYNKDSYLSRHATNPDLDETNVFGDDNTGSENATGINENGNDAVDEDTDDEDYGRETWSKIWLRQHKNRMTDIAVAYYDVFPKLETVFVGKMLFESLPVEEDGHRGREYRIVVIDECKTWLTRTFGWPYQIDDDT